MDSLIKTLPAILAASNNAGEVKDAACVAAWKHAVGETLSLNAIPLRIVEGKLLIAVADGIWKAQLESLRAPLLHRLNSILGGPVVRNLEVSIQPERFRNKTEPTERVSTKDRPIPIELVSAAAEIPDAHLRRAFLGAAVSCVNRIEAQEN
jgi:hypothetical protein